ALMARNATLRSVLIYTMPQRAKDEAARDVAHLVETRRLLHRIGARFPLERVVEAHQAQESGRVTGNIVVDVAPDA
ncbi:MAG TPA: zinc-binding dehydrogenase, partial [Methylomirabilota bacterium]|nr:zinc-binding dehydrogenase [Methylomirabilota bacterium]